MNGLFLPKTNHPHPSILNQLLQSPSPLPQKNARTEWPGQLGSLNSICRSFLGVFHLASADSEDGINGAKADKASQRENARSDKQHDAEGSRYRVREV